MDVRDEIAATFAAVDALDLESCSPTASAPRSPVAPGALDDPAHLSPKGPPP
jgi:hypothetical protein